MKTPTLKDGQIFNTIVTSERHRKHGSCEDGDFATMELIRLQPNQKNLIVSFKEYEQTVELINHKGVAYKKLNSKSNLGGMSREEEAKWMKKQGKFSDQSAIKLVLEIRKRMDGRFSNVSDESFIIIGNTMYGEYCKTKDVKITVCGNLSFNYWLSIGIEACHGGKKNFILNQRNFEQVFKIEKKRFNDGKPKKGTSRGDGHVHFSYPTGIVWGSKYLKVQKVADTVGSMK